MKLIPKHLLIAATAAFVASAVNAPSSHAGQWLDAIFGRQQPVYPVGAPVPVNGQVAVYAPGAYAQGVNAGYVPPAYSNLRSPQVAGYGAYASPPTYNAPLLAPGFPQTVAGQLPTAAYDTQWARTPVTYYRPVTAFDPRYGTTVTSLQPCTSVQYQAQRQPVIAPRPLLGDYGFQANRWPSITGPGYNPTGLSNTAMYAPVVAPIQNIPNSGMTMGNVPNAFAATGVGVASGMPASTLPLRTMQYNPVVSSQPYVAPYLGQQSSYYNGQNYNGQVIANPAYSSSVSALPYSTLSSQPVGTGVVPTAAWMPSAACPNGMCPQTSSTQSPSQLAPPSIPGATVTPVGPPTYSASPNPANGANGFSQSINPPAGAAPVLPNNPIMPPGTNSNDPEAMRQPTLRGGSSASTTPGGNSTSKPGESPFNVQSNSMAADAVSPQNTFVVPEIPETLPPRVNYGMKPLTAPDDFDTKPRFNPTLLDPDDRTAMERAGLLAPDSIKLTGRIRTLEDGDTAVSAVAIESTKPTRSNIQLVSGIETKKQEQVTKSPAENQTIRFRPVTTLN